jgi:hypothetical protein
MRLNPVDFLSNVAADVADFVASLEIHPEGLGGIEKPGEAKSRIRRNPTLFENDVVDPGRGNVKPLRELVCREVQGLQEFLPQNFARMNLPRLAVPATLFHVAIVLSAFNGNR